MIYQPQHQFKCVQFKRVKTKYKLNTARWTFKGHTLDQLTTSKIAKV